MFSAAKTSGPTGVADPQFNYVTALLHGDGTNGAQNNTFLDSSSNAFTVTRNGTPTQGSFSPYGALWSNYFSGSPSSIFFPYASNLTFGSNNFTIECWVNPNRGSGNNSVISGIWDDLSSTPDCWLFFINTTGNLVLTISVPGNQIAILTSSTTVTNNVWSHVAVSRSGSNWYMYINGTQVATASNSTSITSGSANLGIGNFQNDQTASNAFVGYISNLRIVNGTALYTSAFTPSTTPLTAITNTVLLTCQSNRFIDNSSYNYTATINGTTSIQRFNPFLPTSSQAYSTSVYGGSGYFNGSTDYLVTPNNSALYLSTNNFTVELWVYLTSTSSFNIVRGTTTDSFAIVYNSGSFLYYLSSNGSSWNIASGVSMGANSAPLNTWIHVALVRNGNTFTPYINGVAGTTTTSSSAIYQTNGFYLFAEAASGGSGFSYGYSSDFRIVNGSAVYTTNFTPPTAPLTAITNTSLLISMQNAGIYDNAMMNDFITGVSAQISTSVKKYGTGSLSFNGSTDYLVQPYRPFMLWGSANLTIEFWINTTSSTQYATIYSNTQAPFLTGMYSLMINSQSTTSGDVTLYVNEYSNITPLIVTTSNSVRDGNWHHVAMVRNGSSWVIYVNGTSSGTGTFSGAITATTYAANIGCDPYYSRNFGGYIDDFRITYGYARYTSNFTPPTSAFPNY